jgi:hypothetical protein
MPASPPAQDHGTPLSGQEPGSNLGGPAKQVVDDEYDSPLVDSTTAFRSSVRAS